ncbi:uncharacterized protein TRUGW13939_11560 [Talaromyces rugulosus]|uniref:Uncharacterized protein n=1 Tax=Talaromyces rugulosus TaxID=121627 RepID=A0A7H8RDS0_TALRU|nr:uncharacterized protein TRUGW13939_11560 [Talaromyces rugulosus]QKX64386.1 hypothetical protein TRUGW13939_11560 [Talaromyces rugulosus]
MYLSDSEVIIDVLSKARRKAGINERIDVDALLSEPKFVRSLRELWAQIPEKTRRSIGRKPQKAGQKTGSRRSRESNTSMITVSQAVEAIVPQCSQNPLSFFMESDNALDLESSPVSQVYQYLQQLDCRMIINTIRARFLKIAFHRLKERLNLRYMRSNNVDNMAQIISRSGVVDCDLDSIKRKIAQWTDLGGRIEALCRSIGSCTTYEDSHLGNLFCLPADCHDEFIRVLKYTGTGRDQEIQRIKNRGILDVQGKAGLEKLAADVFGVLWAKIWMSIEDFIQDSDSEFCQNIQYTQYFRVEQRGSAPQSNKLTTAVSGSRNNVQQDGTNHPSDEARRGGSSFVPQDNSQTVLPLHTPGLQEQDDMAWMGSTFNIHENPQSMLPLHPTGLQEQDDMAWMGSTFNIHENPQSMLPLHPTGLQGQDAMARMGSTFNIHENPQSMLPLQSLSLQERQSMARVGSTFNIHENPQTLLPCQSFGLQDGQNIMRIGSTFNIHENPQSMLPLQSLGLQDRQSMARVGSTFNIHEKPQTLLPCHSFDLQNGEAARTESLFGTHEHPQSELPVQSVGRQDASNNPINSTGSQDPAQILSNAPCSTATYLDQQQNLSGQSFIPSVLVA